MRIALFLLMIVSASMCLAIEPEIVKKFAIEKTASLRELKDRTDNKYLQEYENICFKFHVSDFIKANKKDLSEEEFMNTDEYKGFVNRVNAIAHETKQKFLNDEMSLVLVYAGEEIIGGTYYNFEDFQDSRIVRMRVSALNRDVGLTQKRFWKQLVKYLTNPKYFPDCNSLIVTVRNTSSEISMLINKLKFTINNNYKDPTRPAPLFTAYERKFKKIKLSE